jgi:hypothetical protein
MSTSISTSNSSINILTKLHQRCDAQYDDFERAKKEYQKHCISYNKTWDEVKHLFVKSSKTIKEKILQTRNPKETRNLVSKFVVEYELNNLLKKNCDEEEEKLKCAHFFNDETLCKTKFICKKKTKKLEETSCGICLGCHSINLLVKTSCGHVFGKKCLSELIDFHFTNNSKKVCCPLCRNDSFDLCRYKISKK